MWYFIFWRGDKLIKIGWIFRKYRGRMWRIGLGILGVGVKMHLGLRIYDDI